jgi:hypothetical protein
MAKYTSRRFSVGDLYPLYWNNFSAHIQTALRLNVNQIAEGSVLFGCTCEKWP